VISLNSVPFIWHTRIFLDVTFFHTQIDVLRRLNYRGANVAKVNDDRIVEELLK